MPQGKKQCPSCKSQNAVRALLCSCGHIFKSKAKKEAKPFCNERKAFIKRMLNNGKSQDYRLDMMTATKIFEQFDNNIDFLGKVKPPFKLNGTIKYFLTPEGKDYLRKKKLEFDFKPQNFEKCIDHFEKVGDDILVKPRQTLRKFLDDE